MLSDSMEPKTFPEISLPYLTPRDKMSLASGERVQRQDRNGCRGSGLVVVDIPSSADLVFDTLTRFGMYQDMIPTVRSSKILANDGINTVAEFTLSRFLLRVNVNHKVLKEQKIIRFNIDQSRPNLVFREADGFWHVQEPSDRPKGYCRVYLSANILAHPMVPPLLLDYAATRALPRATKWLKPYFLENPSYTEHF
jgi:ribosome-associated toxin RatA of RatAB toxin-antitoxin module